MVHLRSEVSVLVFIRTSVKKIRKIMSLTAGHEKTTHLDSQKHPDEFSHHRLAAPVSSLELFAYTGIREEDGVSPVSLVSLRLQEHFHHPEIVFPLVFVLIQPPHVPSAPRDTHHACGHTQPAEKSRLLSTESGNKCWERDKHIYTHRLLHFRFTKCSGSFTFFLFNYVVVLCWYHLNWFSLIY